LVVLNSEHARLAEHGWYRDWSTVAVPATLFHGLSRNGLLNLLRESRRLRRRRARPSASPARRRLASSLPTRALANFIAPNAPPLGFVIRVVAGVGAI